jgi:superfamily II DNA/RNA helicase
MPVCASSLILYVSCCVNSTADAAYAFLTHRGIKCHLYHKNVPAAERAAILTQFQRAPSPSSEPLIMICTNLAARGLDFAKIDHVIQMEFALSLVDHFHRIGR